MRPKKSISSSNKKMQESKKDMSARVQHLKTKDSASILGAPCTRFDHPRPVSVKKPRNVMPSPLASAKGRNSVAMSSPRTKRYLDLYEKKTLEL